VLLFSAFIVKISPPAITVTLKLDYSLFRPMLLRGHIITILQPMCNARRRNEKSKRLGPL
jgi:hypothetical protein